jgi:hypothetical protein
MRRSPAWSVTCFAAVAGATTGCSCWPGCAGRKFLAPYTLQAIADAIVGAGLAAEAEVTAVIADLDAFAADPQTLVAGPRIFQLWVRRP